MDLISNTHTQLFPKNDSEKSQTSSIKRGPRGPNKASLENRELIKSNKKKCGKCGQIKDLEQFHKHKSRVGGVCDECIECACTRNMKRYATARFGPERMSAFKRHAKKLDLPFEITETDLEWLWQRQGGLCYYSKISMVFDIGQDNTVSVDRKNPNKGYVIDNVVLCCHKVNFMKSDISYERFFYYAKQL